MTSWKVTILKSTDSMANAITNLDEEPYKIVLVIDEEEKLIGTITDGDIRRAIIQHKTMNTPLRDIMYADPVYGSPDLSNESIHLMMKTKGILHLPIVDEGHKIIDLKVTNVVSELKKYENPVFLMSGGLGKRLHPLTHDTPKPLLNVGGKPILEIILEQFVEAGFYNFFISTHFKMNMIMDYFGNGSKWNVDIQYIFEAKPLGTAGALGLLPNSLPPIPIIMMNGDLLTKINFEKLLDNHLKQQCIATACVCEYSFQVPYGVVQIENNRLKAIVEKPTKKYFINAGIYVLDPSILESVDGNNYLDMPALLERQIQLGNNINLFPIHEYWLDIGAKEDYEQANLDILD